MESNQDKDLRELSARTEELLSRLNSLSHNLSEKIKYQPRQTAQDLAVNSPTSPIPEETLLPPETKQTQQIINLTATIPEKQIKPEYYTMPLNTHYLEKQEKSIQTNRQGQHFLSTSRTAIFQEINPEEPVKPVKTSSDSNYFYKPVIQAVSQETKKTKASTPKEESLKPSAIFSNDYIPKEPSLTPSSSSQSNKLERTQEVAEQIAAKNKEIKDRLQKYAKRLHISHKGDILRLFALTVPLFALGTAIGLVNAFNVQEIAQGVAIYSICLFIGIFASAGAFRLIEVSELMRWIHNQILSIQTSLDETKTN